MVSAVCTDGAPAMIECKSDLRGLIKSAVPHIAFTHCMLHKNAPVFKMLSSSLADVLKIAVETVNFVRGRALNHRIFMQRFLPTIFVLRYPAKINYLHREIFA